MIDKVKDANTDKLAEATGSEVVQVVGGSIVFYKENPDKEIEV